MQAKSGKAKLRHRQMPPSGITRRTFNGRPVKDWFMFGSDPLPHRQVRRIEKRLLAQGIAPEPNYREGKTYRD
ncbi:hypothetical protein M2368_003572 [Arthrobacter sp. JUb119]|uniref:hypothetical protein n=1 Tax=Arthrobacter sp. JUb115 TaxID=2485108 RepID=UPI0010605034|nr:hypothetical protein [Arthrobacter sp. JUb115]MCS3494540.1 hypothetical protein [Arthrobacter sp. JUb119]TDU22630.1 hypothetical protein EDF61_109160 [Arthrobacter sp. JUb115]